MMGPELHVDLLRDERNSICALRLRYIVYEHGHYALFFYCIFNSYYSFHCAIIVRLLCVIVISSWAHSVALIVQMNRIRFARKFYGSFWRNLAANWHYDGAMC